MSTRNLWWLPSILCAVLAGNLEAEERWVLDRFQRQQLTDVYYSEGANFGDINSDGHMDVVYGPYWFEGPAFQVQHEIYPALAQNRQGYADNFFSWVHDFDGDDNPDVLVVGFPGKPATIYQNPGRDGWNRPWPKHEVMDWVSNESPQLTNLVGDATPEMVCTRDGHFGYYTYDTTQPWKAWQFHPISDQVATKTFGHGLGIGDIDGDGRLDVLHKDGWYQQPESLDTERWPAHAAAFAGPGGAEMYAYDVDGDGDNDVITSLSAHAFGLAWHEQLRDGTSIEFRQHDIMGDTAEDNPYGVLFSELHSVNLADINGDGLKDIVTGKTYWSHHTKSPMWDAGAVVYWFQLQRTSEGVDWIPFQADDDSGIGRQCIVGDVNGDGLPDIVAGGMKGCHVLLHEQQQVDQPTWEAAQPRRRVELASGLDPQAAARQMTALPGFQVQLAAGEPQIHQPIAMAIDHRGRIWVAEAYTYPIRAPEGQGKDKIVILEDTDGDGSLDHRKVFIEGLNLVSGLEVGYGGVWVGAAPYLMFIPDRDADDVPDGDPQILLDGFGYHDTHETLNGFIWGPDGWLYGCHGVFTHSRIGPPGTPDEQRTPMNAAIWRFHPLRHQFEVFAWGTSNPWGVDFNEYGQAFATACVIPHLYHVIQGGRYQRQAGQHFSAHVYDDIKTIADHVHYAGNIRDHAWWGHEPDLPLDTSAAGGGHAHCGAMVYLGDNWPETFRNQVFMNNIHGNRVNTDLLQRQGSGYVGRHGPDLVMANDRWFRGINLRYGPDGTVYLIDWYDPNACHRSNPEIWDRSNGRIYRIRYGDPSPVDVDLAALDDQQLVQLLEHRNHWYARTARRVLHERGGSPQVRQQLVTMVQDTSATVSVRLQALWTLHVIDGLDESLVLQLLDDDQEYLRAWAIQLSLERASASSSMMEQLVRMAAQDSSPVVRLYLASALQRLPVESRWSIAERLVQRAEDAEDHNLPLMIWYGIEPLVTQDPQRAVRLADTAQIPLLARHIIRRAAADNQSLGAVAGLLSETDQADRQRMVLDQMLLAFQGRVDIPMPDAWTPAYEALIRSEHEDIVRRAEQTAVILGDQRIFPRLRAVLTDRQAPLDARRNALDILVRGRDKQAAESIQKAVADPDLRGAAIRALAAFDHAATPATILPEYGRMTDEQRRDAIATLVTRPAYALALLKAIEQKQVPRSDLHAYHVRQLAEFEHSELKQRLGEVWGTIRETSQDKAERISQYKQQLTPAAMKQADAAHGRVLFDKTCASCHILFGEGTKVGPDITGSNRANLDYILENIVDPSAVLGDDYRMTVIATVDGRVISGLLQQETDSALTLRTINDSVIVPKSDIDEQQLSKLSLMPEGLLDNLTADDLRNLVAYLASPTQVAPRGPSAPIDPSTGRVPQAVEGEAMKIVGKSGGTARSQDMKPFTKDRWSGNDHLWWTGAEPGGRLDLELPVQQKGNYALEIVMTKAQDYGIVQLYLNDSKLGGPIDLFNQPDVITTGVLEFEGYDLDAGTHTLSIEILGAHPEAVKAYMFGLDYVRLRETERSGSTGS